MTKLFYWWIFSLHLATVTAQNYYYIGAVEHETININCNEENVPSSDPYLVVDEVKYTFDNCNHTDPYGVRNECDNKTSCSFQVTNSLVGSSCGGSEGDARIAIKYHCVREGAWSSWGSYTSCTRYCGGGYQYRERSCTNPTRNYFGTNEACNNDVTREYRRCNTQDCSRSGSDCRYNNFEEHCDVYSTNGYMTITGASYYVFTTGCGYSHNEPSDYHTHSRPNYGVTSYVSEQCNGRYYCTFYIDDSTVNRGTSCNRYYQQVHYYCCYHRTCYRQIIDSSRYDGEEWHYTYRQQSYCCDGTCHYYDSHHVFCNVVYWNYYCTIPEWTIWGSWSSCSQTCNRGIQTRTRSCENERTTVDGHLVECCQPLSECHTTETRECPMLGLQPYCTYCSGAPERYKDVKTSDIVTDTNAGNAVILESDIHIVRCCGLINKWQFVPKSAGTLTLIVWRPTGTAGEEHIRTIVGTNTVTVAESDVGNITSFIPSLDRRIAVKAGDLIGWHGTSPDMIGRESCSEVMNVGNDTDTAWDYRPNYCPMKTYKTIISNLTEGTIVDWSNTVLQNWFYAIQYEATTNTPPVFNMSVVSVSHPDHLPIDTSLIQFYFTDGDYGDSYVKYYPDYNHPYLYFDSNELAIYSKTALPHTIGTHEQETTFVVSAEDGCYNRVTGTVTVTTYNVGPQFHDLPETVMIDDTRTGEMYYINVTDHQDDPINCTVTGTTPLIEAGFFYVDGHFVLLGVNFTLNKDNLSEYRVNISCSDGTDVNTTYVIFETQSGTPEFNEIKDSPFNTVLVIVISFGAVLLAAVVSCIVVIFQRKLVREKRQKSYDNLVFYDRNHSQLREQNGNSNITTTEEDSNGVYDLIQMDQMIRDGNVAPNTLNESNSPSRCINSQIDSEELPVGYIKPLYKPKQKTFKKTTRETQNMKS